MKSTSTLRAFALLAAASATLAAPATARQPTDVPLEHVLALAKPYPNLVLQIRLELVRASLKRENVSCAATPAGAGNPRLAAVRIAPYRCTIGKRQLIVETTPTFLDAGGRRLKGADLSRAASVREERLKWRWQ
jgi:hypothetical protein